MTRGRWIAVALLLAVAGGTYWAADAGYLAQGRDAYSDWAEQRRLASDGRVARGEKPTLTDMALDNVARWVPARRP